jgi:Ni2+-binding GTPase involved in maturation of urease and hydrogenase
MDVRVPVNVVTGPLGAGKTTLVNRLLAALPDRRVAVIETEFGDEMVALDDVVASQAELIEQREGTMRADLVRALERLVRRRDPPERVVIETEGDTDPAVVVRTILGDGDLRDRLAIDSVVVVVAPGEEPLEAQLKVADVVCVRGDDAALVARVEAANPQAARIEGDGDVLRMIGIGVPDPLPSKAPAGAVPGSLSEPDPPVLAVLAEVALPDWVTSVGWRPDGGYLAAACADGSVHEVLPDGSASAPLAHHEGSATAVSFSLSGTLAHAGSDGRVAIVPRPAQLAGGGWIDQAQWSPDGALLATAVDRRVQIWTAEGALANSTEALPAAVGCLAWSPDGGRLAVGTAGAVIMLGRDAAPLDEDLHADGVPLCLAWAPEGQRLACGLLEREIALWDVEDRRCERLGGYMRKIRELGWSADGSWLATGGGQSVTLWRFLDGADDIEEDAQSRLHAHEDAISWVGFQPFGEYLATTGEDGLALLWAPPAEQPIGALAVHEEISTAAWSLAGDRLALGCASGRLIVLAVS